MEVGELGNGPVLLYTWYIYIFSDVAPSLHRNGLHLYWKGGVGPELVAGSREHGGIALLCTTCLRKLSDMIT
jgi:hypothetical protein